jgi:hypothetical protein
MIQEEKDLLLKDLSARLPYGVKCVSGVDDATLIIEGINPNCNGASEVQVTYERSGINFDTKISSIKPYLFPLSSMTEEQKKYITDRWGINEDFDFEIDPNWGEYFVDLGDAIDYINWLYKNHFDVYGLIEKGLALDVTNLNIY